MNVRFATYVNEHLIVQRIACTIGKCETITRAFFSQFLILLVEVVVMVFAKIVRLFIVLFPKETGWHLCVSVNGVIKRWTSRNWKLKYFSISLSICTNCAYCIYLYLHPFCCCLLFWPYLIISAWIVEYTYTFALPFSSLCVWLTEYVLVNNSPE